MARRKASVVTCHTGPKPVEAAPAVDPLGTPSVSFSTTSTASTCPHCNSTFQDISVTDFRYHVESCTRASTADDSTSGSSISTPLITPSHLAKNSIVVDVIAKDLENVDQEVDQIDLQSDLGVVGEPFDAEVYEVDAEYGIRPYVNPNVEFDYYDQSEAQEGSDVEQKTLEPAEKFPFPKVIDVEVFEDYLRDAEGMTYDELYRRTAVVSDSLNAWQTEWDQIDKEIYAHETMLRAKDKRAEELAKEISEKERIKDDFERDQVAEAFGEHLKLQGKQWQEWIAEYEAKYPDETRTIRHLQNLKNPQFMATARKKQRQVENKAKRFIDVPDREPKKTKEELEVERRKRGRLVDSLKFDDMKMADVYGFEYSSHIKHYGQQPMPVGSRQTNATSDLTSNQAGDYTNEASRTRTQRKQTRKFYEADKSATPEPESEEGRVPAKRARKPKIFEDGVETTAGRSRGQSRSGTPVVRTFASGKRVGRPPAKSKLQAVQLAQRSESPEPISQNDEGQVQDNDSGPRELAPFQEAQLHDAAESLVNQTVSDKAVKPKHAGGRPKKIIIVDTTNQSEVPVPGITQPKARNKGGRPKKNPVPIEAAPQHVAKAATKSTNRSDRVKKEVTHEDNDVESGEENEVLESTEPDEGSQYTSAPTTRPTTSDSNATASSFASRRSARPATRDKTNAREAKSAAKSEVSSGPTSSRNKRKRASSDTEPSPIVVDFTSIQVVEPPRKRKTRGVKQDSEDVIATLPEAEPEASTGRPKRKRGDTINEFIAVAGPSTQAELAPVPKRHKSHGAKAEEKAEEEDSDADIDEESLDPVAREALRKKRIKKEKSRKLSENMKARWASGGMIEAQATRKTNNALKKAAKKAAADAQAAGRPPPPPPVLLPTTASVRASKSKTEPEPAPTMAPAVATPTSAPKSTKKRTKSNPDPPTRPASTRVRKPTRTAMGLDGVVDDNDDEVDQQFSSEYDRYQALTSRGSPIVLGKRVRKSLFDLSQVMDNSDDEGLEY